MRSLVLSHFFRWPVRAVVWLLLVMSVLVGGNPAQGQAVSAVGGRAEWLALLSESFRVLGEDGRLGPPPSGFWDQTKYFVITERSSVYSPRMFDSLARDIRQFPQGCALLFICSGLNPLEVVLAAEKLPAGVAILDAQVVRQAVFTSKSIYHNTKLPRSLPSDEAQAQRNAKMLAALPGFWPRPPEVLHYLNRGPGTRVHDAEGRVLLANGKPVAGDFDVIRDGLAKFLLTQR